MAKYYEGDYYYRTPKVIDRLIKQKKEDALAKDLAKNEDANERIDTGDHDHPVMIRRSLMEKVKNKAGIEMWKYKYWKIEASEIYRVSEPEEYERILKAIASPDVRFVYIGKDFVNINQIKSIKERVGYKEIK